MCGDGYSLGDAGDGGQLTHLIPDRRGRYSFLEIADYAHLDTVHAAELLWKEAWRGNVTSDTFRTIRKGAMSGFTPQAFSDEARMASRRSGFNRWKVSRPMEGHWLRIDSPPKERDILEEEDLVKDRIRQILKRYGDIKVGKVFLNQYASDKLVEAIELDLLDLWGETR